MSQEFATSFLTEETLLGDDGSEDQDHDHSHTENDGLSVKERDRILATRILQAAFPPPPTSPSYRKPPTESITPERADVLTTMITGFRPIEFPPTPETTPSKTPPKRCCAVIEEEDGSCGDTPSKRTKSSTPCTPFTPPTSNHPSHQRSSQGRSSSPTATPNKPRRTLFNHASTPKYSIAHKSSFSQLNHSLPSAHPSTLNPTTTGPRYETRKTTILSELEAKRVIESVLRQVKWEEVASDVASNRSWRIYRRWVKAVLRAEMDGMGDAAGVEEMG